MHIHTYTSCAPVHMCVRAYVCMSVCMYIVVSIRYWAHKVTQTQYKSIQGFVEAFMMGTHARLGAHSPVLQLDPYLAVSIAQIIIADRWCVPHSAPHFYVLPLYLLHTHVCIFASVFVYMDAFKPFELYVLCMHAQYASHGSIHGHV